MIYCDTSVLVSALTAEPMGATVRRWLAARDQDTIAISWLVDVELASALAAKVRAKELSRRQHQGVMDQWADMRTNVEVIGLAQRDYSAAAELASAGTGLRAADALHLALARHHRWTVATLDRRLAAAARSASVDLIGFAD